MNQSFQKQRDDLLIKFWRWGSSIVPTIFWQSQEVSNRPGFRWTREWIGVNFVYDFPSTQAELAADIQPSIPWAEDHFLERISGEPLNPPPSEAWWPFAVQGNSEHKADQKFSHTYPERFWPKQAGYEPYFDGGWFTDYGHMGIRYRYGDLEDVVNMLLMDPMTRQAYLPVWFPEDTGSVEGQRVPCTLGYQFLYRPFRGGYQATIIYGIRSCDFVRHFDDDVYMACRLLQWISNHLVSAGMSITGYRLIMNISSLHTFEGDEFMMEKRYNRAIDRAVYATPI